VFRPKYPETPTLPTAHVITSAPAPVQHHAPPAPRIAPSVGVGVAAVAGVVTVGSRLRDQRR
jgi:hypothetical protein